MRLKFHLLTDHFAHYTRYDRIIGWTMIAVVPTQLHWPSCTSTSPREDAELNTKILINEIIV
jgi:hypothetical protein